MSTTPRTPSGATATITIFDGPNGIEVRVKNEPEVSGPSRDWPIPALIAQKMIKDVLEHTKACGIEPIFEATKNMTTGHIDVIDRTRKNNEI
jgi:hypothetical protein